MKRVVCLGIFTLVGVFAIVAANEARQDRANLTLHRIADNLYMLANDPAVQGMGGGGNTGVFVTGSGVVLVDTKISGYGADILTHVREVTDLPVSTIINTHTHWDHSGSNIEFSDTVNFVAHENTLAHMSQPTCDDGAGYQGGSITNCEAFRGENAKYLPETTFSNRTSLFSGSDQIDLYYFGRGHTDGDIFVVFKEARTMQTGDMFARRGLPYLDVENTNGSAVEFGATLRKAVEDVDGVDTIIRMAVYYGKTLERHRPSHLGRFCQLQWLLQRHLRQGESGAGGRSVSRPGGQFVLGAWTIQRFRSGPRQVTGDRAVHLRWEIVTGDRGWITFG